MRNSFSHNQIQYSIQRNLNETGLWDIISSSNMTSPDRERPSPNESRSAMPIYWLIEGNDNKNPRDIIALGVNFDNEVVTDPICQGDYIRIGFEKPRTIDFDEEGGRGLLKISSIISIEGSWYFWAERDIENLIKKLRTVDESDETSKMDEINSIGKHGPGWAFLVEGKITCSDGNTTEQQSIVLVPFLEIGITAIDIIEKRVKADGQEVWEELRMNLTGTSMTDKIDKEEIDF